MFFCIWGLHLADTPLNFYEMQPFIHAFVIIYATLLRFGINFVKFVKSIKNTNYYSMMLPIISKIAPISFRNLGLTLIIALINATILTAQNPIARNAAKPKGAQISFDHTRFDFGPINENIKFASHKFGFTNTGNAPLVLNKVETSCGCTTPEWSTDTVKPGEQGYVTARYETTNRLGTFTKSITVYSNSIESPMVFLDISGDVYRENTDLQSNTEIKYNYGKVTFSKPALSFSPLYDNRIDTQSLFVTNETPTAINIYALDPGILPPYIKILQWPTTLEPQERGKVQIAIDGRKINYYGFGTFEIPMNTSSPALPYGSVFVTFSRKQFFPKYSATQLAKQPKLTLDKKEHNFGMISEAGDIITTEIKFTNSGKQLLKIYNMDPSCGCISLKAPKKELQPGESMIVKVIFDTVTKKGYSNYSIGIICNDPTNPEFEIPIKAQFPAKDRHCLTCPK
jgi:hypothetical protein